MWEIRNIYRTLVNAPRIRLCLCHETKISTLFGPVAIIVCCPLAISACPGTKTGDQAEYIRMGHGKYCH